VDGGSSIGHVGGDATVTINNGTPVAQQPARSFYLQQVKQIAPDELLDREAELADLTDYCLSEEHGAYAWWQAGPWAGKTALLSTFVTEPPEALTSSGVVLVSFFITARLAAQDTREAFTATLIEQLCALLGQELPVASSANAQEAALLELLETAAHACRRAGGRLVLVVDGLDEDRGATRGPQARSIAALLPKKPWAGMRVIVAGRPNPPIPDDVPHRHPLRQAGIVRKLVGSPHAEDRRQLGVSELKRLLNGTALEKDLLGLVTAARGGLSGPDLRELTGADLVEIEEILHTVTGRTFGRRPARWAPNTESELYLLGHEELQRIAIHYIGENRLDEYRGKLHAWAERYRAPSDGRAPWPPDTPEYLLTGYPRMLTTTKDAARLTSLALDRARHDRMLELTGGDTAALNEITASQDLLLGSQQPDLYALARLSRHRDELELRNSFIPVELPALWATLGQPDRAEQLARAMSIPSARVQAMADLARAVAATGDTDRAHRLTLHAEQTARTITHPMWRASAYSELVGAAMASGDPARARQFAELAEQSAGNVADLSDQAWALIELAEAVAASGDHEHTVQWAERSARNISEPSERARALAQMARTMAAAGDQEQSRRLFTAAERTARSISDRSMQLWTLIELVEEAADGSDFARAQRLAVYVEQIARTISDTESQVEALAFVAAAAAAAGNDDHARRLAIEVEHRAQGITEPLVLAAVAKAVSACGNHERAQLIARTVTDPHARTRALAAAAEAAAAAGEYQQAAQLAHTITYPDKSALTLADAAKTAAAAGDHDRARLLATHAERTARNVVAPSQQISALGVLARAASEAGDRVCAHRLAALAEWTAQADDDLYQQVRALAAVAGLATAVGGHNHARQVAADAEQTARAITDPEDRARALAEAADAAAEAGDHKHAEQIALEISVPQERVRALCAASGSAAASGNHEDGRQLATLAEQAARTIVDREEHARALSALAETWADVGDQESARQLAVYAEQMARSITDVSSQGRALFNLLALTAGVVGHAHAEQVARSIADRHWRAQSFAALAEAMAASGDHERADQIANTITDTHALGRALAAVADTVAATGDHQRAEQIARTIAEPDWRAQALTSVAKAAGPPRARRLLGEAFSLGSWLTPLPVMAQFYPQEVIRFAETEYPDESPPDFP
jgi:hypothetical protein